MAGITYLHTGGVLSRKSGGGHTFKLCTIFPHTLELLLAFRYDWENETILPGTLRHFKRYQTCMVTYLYILHCMDFSVNSQWWGEGEMMRPSVQGVDPPVCCTPGCYCYICKRQLCGFPQCAASWMLLLYARDSSRWLLTPGPHFLSRGAQTFWHRARAYNILSLSRIILSQRLGVILLIWHDMPLRLHLSSIT